MLRRRKLSRLSVDPNDDTMRCPIAEPETEGMIATAEACCEAWKSHFETQEWRDGAADSMRAVSAIYFHWAGEGAIVRPADVQFARLTSRLTTSTSCCARARSSCVRNRVGARPASRWRRPGLVRAPASPLNTE